MSTTRLEFRQQQLRYVTGNTRGGEAEIKRRGAAVAANIE
jgi:hypothetical protein